MHIQKQNRIDDHKAKQNEQDLSCDTNIVTDLFGIPPLFDRCIPDMRFPKNQ